MILFLEAFIRSKIVTFNTCWMPLALAYKILKQFSHFVQKVNLSTFACETHLQPTNHSCNHTRRSSLLSQHVSRKVHIRLGNPLEPITTSIQITPPALTQNNSTLRSRDGATPG